MNVPEQQLKTELSHMLVTSSIAHFTLAFVFKSYNRPNYKKVAHPKMKILLFTDPHFIPNLLKILYLMEHKIWYFVKMGIIVLFCPFHSRPY